MKIFIFMVCIYYIQSTEGYNHNSCFERIQQFSCNVLPARGQVAWHMCTPIYLDGILVSQTLVPYYNLKQTRTKIRIFLVSIKLEVIQYVLYSPTIFICTCIHILCVHVGPLPESRRGYKYIITVTDYFSKWPEAAPLQDKTAVGVADFLFSLFCRQGWPERIISDQGREFVNAVSRYF